MWGVSNFNIIIILRLKTHLYNQIGIEAGNGIRKIPAWWALSLRHNPGIFFWYGNAEIEDLVGGGGGGFYRPRLCHNKFKYKHI